MKTCTKCGEAKPLTFFYRHKGGKDGLRAQCIQCFKSTQWPASAERAAAYSRAHRMRHPDANKRSMDKCLGPKRALLFSLKNGRPCADCGVVFPSYVMDFDHREPSIKLFNVARLAGRSLDEIRAEATKCDLVCANCHRERTFGPRRDARVASE